MGHGSIVTTLIDAGADLNVIDGKGCTSLHAACGMVKKTLESSREIIRELILAGADTQARNIKGRLPVEVLRAADNQSRAMYEEAVEEMDSQALKPVLK
jgi:ankyrin repeat protein